MCVFLFRRLVQFTLYPPRWCHCLGPTLRASKQVSYLAICGLPIERICCLCFQFRPEWRKTSARPELRTGNFPVLAGTQMDPAKSLKKVLKPEFLGKLMGLGGVQLADRWNRKIATQNPLTAIKLLGINLGLTWKDNSRASAQFPDDDNFKLYKVYKKFKSSRFFHAKKCFRDLPSRVLRYLEIFLRLWWYLILWACKAILLDFWTICGSPISRSPTSNTHYRFFPIFGCQGADVNTAGTRTSARGTVASSASKKLLGEALESQVADLKKDGPEKGKTRRAGNSNADKNKNTSRPRSDDASKKLQKDIKGLLIKQYFDFLFTDLHLSLVLCLYIRTYITTYNHIYIYIII